MRAMASATEQTGVPHAKIQRLIDHWRALAPAPGLLPGRQHLDPARIAALLPHVWLLDILAGPPRRYRYRLIGTGIIDAGTPVRPGDFVDDPKLSPQPASAARIIDAAVDCKAPDWRRGPPVVHHSKQVRELERVLLPLARDGVNVDMVLGMTLFYWTDGRVY